MTESKSSTPLEKKTFAMEVEYTYTHDKESDPQASWWYHWVTTDTIKRAETATKKQFTEMVNSTGWTSKVKIISIQEMKNSKTTPETEIVSSDVLAPARTRKTPTGTARKSQTTTKRKTTTKKTSTKTTTRKPRATKASSTTLPL